MNVSLLLAIAVLLLLAKVLGELAQRLRLSSLVGEVAAGVLAGPVLHVVSPAPLLEEIAGIGLLLFFFLVGLSTKFDDVKKDVYPGSVLAVLGAVLSFVAGFAIGYVAFRSVTIAAFLGAAIVSTSTPIGMRALIDSGELHSRAGRMLVTINMADDVVGIIALSLLAMSVAGGVNVWPVAALFFTIVGFFYFNVTVGSRFINSFLKMFQSMRDEQVLITVPIVIMLVGVFLSEHIILAGIMGAFLVGMAMSKSQLTEPIIIPKISILGYGFFIPLFFAYSAIALDIASLAASFWFISALAAASIAAKVVGSGLFARHYGFNRHEQLLIGLGMAPRGEYTIVIAQIAVGAALITQELYTALIAYMVVTIVLTPLLIKVLVKK